MIHDVIVVGGGPAGAVAAINCARNGLKVLLICKKPGLIIDSRLRPSESVHPGIMALLTPSGAHQCLEEACRGFYEGVTTNNVFVPLGSGYDQVWKGYHIDRSLFDRSLLQLAKVQGVSVCEDESAVDLIIRDDRVCGLITTQEKYFSNFVIDASGHKAFAGRLLHWKASFHSPPLAVWTGISEGLPADFFGRQQSSTFFIPASSGWSWLAPEPGGKCSWTRLSTKGIQRFDPPELLAGFSLCSDVIASNRRWRSFKPVCREGLLAVGDAAGIIDPAAGQGIFNAVLSATMAARTIASCMNAPSFEALYLLRYNQWFEHYYSDKTKRLQALYGELGIDLRPVYPSTGSG